jgi:YD repeat-containing protein
LKAYDASGRLVSVLVDDEGKGSDHRVRWDGVDAFGHPLAPGIYTLLLDLGTQRLTRNIVILN